METPVTLETALHLRRNNLSIIPTRPDGTKAPALPWKAYQVAPAPIAEVNEWYRDGNRRNLGIAIVTGKASDRLEMTEIEGPQHRLARTLTLRRLPLDLPPRSGRQGARQHQTRTQRRR